MLAELQSVREANASSGRPVVAFGPVTPGWGSWEWIGEDLAAAIGKWFAAVKFGWESLPECDVMVVVKHPLPERLCRQIPAATRIVFCPVDHYASPAEIDADRAWLARCSRIV